MLPVIRMTLLATSIAVLAGCQPNAIAYKSDTTGQWYGLFYSPADHVEELVAAGDFVQASTVWQDQRAWFAEKPEQQGQWLPAIKQGLFRHYDAPTRRQIDLVEDIAWPQQPDQWSTTRRMLGTADTHLQALERHDLLWQADAPGYGPALKGAIGSLRDTIDTTLLDDFFDYDLAGDILFGSVHPYPANLKSRLQENTSALAARIDEEPWQELAAIDNNYSPYLPLSLREDMADRYYRARVDAEADSHRSHAEAMLSIWKNVHDDRKMKLPRIPDDMLQIVSMLNPDDSSFDLSPAFGPVSSTSVPWQSYDPRQHYADADIVLVMVSQDHLTDLAEDGREPTKSQYYDGMREIRNPAFQRAREAYDTALRNYNRSVRELNRLGRESCDSATSCQDLEWRYDTQSREVDYKENDLDFASNTLDTTPQTISEAVYRDYRYDLVRYTTSRSAEILLLEFNNLTGKALRYTWLAEQAKTFKVPENLHREDRKADSIRKNNHSLKDAENWAKADFSFSLSELYLKVDDTDIQRASVQTWLPRSN